MTKFQLKKFKILGTTLYRPSSLRSPLLFYCDRHCTQLNFRRDHWHICWFEKWEAASWGHFEKYMLHLWWRVFSFLNYSLPNAFFNSRTESFCLWQQRRHFWASYQERTQYFSLSIFSSSSERKGPNRIHRIRVLRLKGAQGLSLSIILLTLEVWIVPFWDSESRFYSLGSFFRFLFVLFPHIWSLKRMDPLSLLKSFQWKYEPCQRNESIFVVTVFRKKIGLVSSAPHPFTTGHGGRRFWIWN